MSVGTLPGGLDTVSHMASSKGLVSLAASADIFSDLLALQCVRVSSFPRPCQEGSPGLMRLLGEGMSASQQDSHLSPGSDRTAGFPRSWGQAARPLSGRSLLGGAVPGPLLLPFPRHLVPLPQGCRPPEVPRPLDWEAHPQCQRGPSSCLTCGQF